jgi:photosystem II stability/assembly factor-like uncharacterized protein
MDIKPQPGPDEAPLRWNWDSPLIISPHLHTRLYFAANRLFRSDDRGDSWEAVSPDLTRQIDRNRLEMMGRVWSVDAVSKNASTSYYGNIVALAESPLQEGLLFVGTDDGLIQISEDGGENWRKIERFSGVPEMSYVSSVTPSRHDVNTVYATFVNYKMGDFKPYVLKSTDLGRSWRSITGDLPKRGSSHVIEQDHVDEDLLFVGTEFGVFFTNDGGRKWVQLKGGMPTIFVRDLAIQRRENDLVLGTFGRGIYILDDYSPLRVADGAMLARESALLPVRTAWAYIESTPLGGPGKNQQGDAFYTAPNPPFGAVFTYYLRDAIKTKREIRQEKETEIQKKGGDVYYPSWEALRAEDREEKPTILLTVSDGHGNVVRRLEGPVASGFHRVAWDLRYPPADPTSLEEPGELAPWERAPAGPLAVPGTYQVSLAKRVEGKVTRLAGPVEFEVVAIGTPSIPPGDRGAQLAFERKTARLQRAVRGAVESAQETQKRIDHLKKALRDAPAADPGLADEARALEARLKDLQVALTGDRAVARRNEPTLPSIQDRVELVIYGTWYSTSAPTRTQQQGYDIAARQFAPVLQSLRTLVEVDLAGLERRAEAAGAPWTPGRVPVWTPE